MNKIEELERLLDEYFNGQQLCDHCEDDKYENQENDFPLCLGEYIVALVLPFEG